MKRLGTPWTVSRPRLRRRSVLTASVLRARVMPTYISRRSSSSRCARHLLVLAAERQQPFVDAGQHHVRPLQALGGMQRRQRDHVLLVAALGQADDHARSSARRRARSSSRSRQVGRRRSRSRRRSAWRSSRRSPARCSSARRRASRCLRRRTGASRSRCPSASRAAAPSRLRRRWCGARGTRGRSRSGRTRAASRSRARSARVPSVSANSASYRLVFHLPANSPRLASVWWPMPRLGVVTARRNAGSSSLLTSRRSQAHRSLISARSKKLWPPDTLYGMLRLAQRFLEHAGLVVGAVQDREVA